MVLDNGSLGVHAGEKNLVLAFDPGRDKIGFALANLEGKLIFSGIFPAKERETFFQILLASQSLKKFLTEPPDKDVSNFIERIKFIAVGNGTHSKEFQKAVSCLPFEIKIVNERNTTLEARNLYWKLHRPGFLVSLLPEGLRVPPRVLDDLAAWAIARRSLIDVESM